MDDLTGIQQANRMFSAAHLLELAQQVTRDMLNNIGQIRLPNSHIAIAIAMNSNCPAVDWKTDGKRSAFIRGAQLEMAFAERWNRSELPSYRELTYNPPTLLSHFLFLLLFDLYMSLRSIPLRHLFKRSFTTSTRKMTFTQNPHKLLV